MLELEKAIQEMEVELLQEKKAEEDIEKSEESKKIENEEEKNEDDVEDSQEENEENEEDEEVIEQKDEDDDVDLKKKSAWVKMRQSNKELKRQNQEFIERLAKLEGFAEGIKSNEKKQVEEIASQDDVEPDKDYDRESWLEWKQNKLEEKLIEVQEQSKKAENLSLVQSAKEGIRILEQNAKKEIPDYDDAYNYYFNAEKRLIKIQYPDATDAQIDQHLQNEKMNTFAKLVSTGKNPAKVVYELAQAVGYKKAAPSIQKGSNIDAINKNQRKSVSLIGGTNAGKAKSKSSEAVFNNALNDLLSKPDSFFKEAESEMMSDY